MTKDKQQVYISGQITGLDYKEVWLRFKAVQHQLEDAGYLVYNPCCIQLPAGSTHEQYMQWDLPHLQECDIIYFLDGWEKSHGCRYEHQLALATGKDIRYEGYAKYALKLKNFRMVWLEQAAEIMQIGVADLVGRKRDRYICNRRLAAIVYLFTKEQLDFRMIGELLKRDRNTIRALYYTRQAYMKDIEPLLKALFHVFGVINESPQEEQPQPLPLFSDHVKLNNNDL